MASCPLSFPQTCTDVQAQLQPIGTTCASLAANAEAGSLNATVRAGPMSCLASYSLLRPPICTEVLEISAINESPALMASVESPVVATAVGAALFLLYFCLPLGYFVAVVLARQSLFRGSAKTQAAGEPEDDGDEESSALPVYLSFHRLSYAVKLDKAKAKASGSATKQILKRVTGVFRPGTLSAIMGPSGCGKSTLLDVLADRKHDGETRGKVLVNGRTRGEFFSRVSSYVMQFDALFPYLTVREMLAYTAELRLGGTDVGAKRRAVERVIRSLDLGRVADTRIGGGGLAGISGGQARRVTVGLELVTRPRVLFLDEPTTGLDAFSSLQLVRTLRVLANTGRTVVATIHQPRPDIFDLFNTLLLMKSGEICYFGPVRGIRPYFLSIGIEVPPDASVADFVVDLTYAGSGGGGGGGGDAGAGAASAQEAPSDDRARVVQALADAYSSSAACARMNATAAEIEGLAMPGLPPPAASLFCECDPTTGQPLAHTTVNRYAQSIFLQTVILLRRSYKNIGRNRTYFTNVSLQMSQFLFYGLLFLGLRTENPPYDAGAVIGIGDLASLQIITIRAALFQVMNTVMLVEAVVIAGAFTEKTIFHREEASGAYSVTAYHLQFIVRFYVDAAWKGLLAACLFYFWPPMLITADAFFYFAAMLMVCSTMGSALAFLMVSLIPDAEGAGNVHAQILGTFGLYSGFFLFPQLLPVWMKWIYYILPFKYSYEGLELNQFTCMTNGDNSYFFTIDPTLNRWTNLIVFMVYPPIFHAIAVLASFLHTRPASFWANMCGCCKRKQDDAEDEPASGQFSPVPSRVPTSAMSSSPQNATNNIKPTTTSSETHADAVTIELVPVSMATVTS